MGRISWRSIQRTLPIAVAALCAALFVALCSPALDGQGLYYDEAHQAPAAFLYLGKPVYTFTPLVWHDIPLLTMPYSGAIKSNLFGIVMKTTGLRFTVVSWRLFGIALAASGLFVCCWLAAGALQPFGLLVFVFCVLTDGTVLLTSRHDWGPTALALALRLIWIGAWLKSERDTSDVWLILLGFVPALSIYEKLNNVVLLGPLAIVALVRQNRSLRRGSMLVAGFVLGLIPIVVVNLLTKGISYRIYLEAVANTQSESLRGDGLWAFLQHTLPLGGGEVVSQFVLGVEPMVRRQLLELWTVGFALGFVAVVVWAWGRRDACARLAGLSLLCYISVLALIFYGFGRISLVHHWIVATPFQYVAIAFAAQCLQASTAARADRDDIIGVRSRAVMRRAGFAILAVFAIGRVDSIWSLEKYLMERRAGRGWDPSYTSVAAFAVQHREEALFLAADWGFGTQIYALSNGEFPVREAFVGWADRAGGDTLLEYAASRPRQPIYVLRQKPELSVYPEVADDIVRTVESMTARLPLDDELQRMTGVPVLKFAPPDIAALEACTAPPPAPHDLRIVSNAGGTVRLSWEGTRTKRTSYVIVAGTTPGAADLGSQEVGWTTVFRASHLNAAIYYVRVRGKNRCGSGDASNEVVVVVA